jgi:glucan phosphoethanolaminetransferase (alkaline phosphatase superfamily)
LAAFIITIASLRPFSYDLTLLQLGAARGAISKGLHLFFLCEVFYILTCASLRISVGLLLLRVASSPAQRRVIYLIMLLMICSSIAFLFVVIFQCNPISYFWNETPGAVGTCVKSSTVADTGYAHMAVAFISDWTLGLLPAWLLWNVQISRGRKIGISILLGFGLL